MRIKEGVITSAKMDKTVVVTVQRYKTHPKYKKKYRVSKKFMAHSPQNSYKEGDRVSIVETRPLSKNKRWRVATPEEVLEIIAKAKEKHMAAPVSDAQDEVISVTFEARKRAKTRGVRMKEKTETPAAPASAAPTPEAAAPAAETPAPEKAAPVEASAPETPPAA